MGVDWSSADCSENCFDNNMNYVMRVRGASGRYDWTSFSMVFETEPEPPIQSDDSAFYEILVEITKVFV